MSTRGSRRSGGRDDGDKEPRRFTAKDKGKGKCPKNYSEEESSEDLPDTVDWRNTSAVNALVLNQKAKAICWAISIVRAIEALLNINVPNKNLAKELSIQHLVNQVEYNDNEGIANIRRALKFAKDQGICSSSQCPSRTVDNNVAAKFKCKHPKHIHTETIDDFEYITDVHDHQIRAIVARQPVIGILRNTDHNFDHHSLGDIYRSPPVGGPDISFHQVLIVGYGFDSNGEPYWIIQNSYGTTWGVGGYGYIYRRVQRGSGSEFCGVAYPRKRNYPRRKDGA